MNDIYDVLVVGSGAAGTSAAFPLVKAGLKVALVDGGTEIYSKTDWPQEASFESVRKNAWNQRYLFFGKELSGLLPSSSSQAQYMTIGQREFVSRLTSELLPVETDLDIVQSLAQGGLSEAWTGACDIFTDEELRKTGLPNLKIMHKYYQSIIDRMGVSGEHTGYKLQPPVKLDHNARIIYRKAKQNNDFLKRNKVELNKSLLAVLTKKKGERQPVSYNDLHFWINQSQSLYTPHLTLEELKKYPNFRYHPKYLVESVAEPTKNKALVHAANMSNLNMRRSFVGHFVILAAGSINTSRIMLKSYNLYGTKIPFLTKEHALIPCLNLEAIGIKGDVNRISYAQLVMEAIDRNITSAYCILNSYKSLLYYRMVPFIPLPSPFAFSLLSLIGDALVIANLRLSTEMNRQSYLQLIKKNNSEILKIVTNINDDAKKIDKLESVKRILTCLKKMRILPLKTVTSPHGSSAHYASGVPFSAFNNEFPLSCDQNGKLQQGRNIYIADAANWRFLPAKHPTLTIMANAERIGENIVRLFNKR